MLEHDARDIADRICGSDRRLWGMTVGVARPLLEKGGAFSRDDIFTALDARIEEIIRRTGDRQPKAHADELRTALQELKAAQA